MATTPVRNGQLNVEHVSMLFAEMQAELMCLLTKLSNLRQEVCHTSEAQVDVEEWYVNRKRISECKFPHKGLNIEVSRCLSPQPPRILGDKAEEREDTDDSDDDERLTTCMQTTSIFDFERQSSIFTTHSKSEASLLPGTPKNAKNVDELLLTCRKGSERRIKNLMTNRADPNMRFGSTLVAGKKYTFCTPLAISIMREQFSLAKWLIECNADPDSEYGFKAGAGGMDWSGPCSHATIPKGRQTGLELLIACRADVHRTASNGASLLYQAAYFNQASIVAYLLNEGVDLEQRATNQDNADHAHTPLHIAAKKGHDQVVGQLLKAKAECDVIDQFYDDTVSQLRQSDSGKCDLIAQMADDESCCSSALEDAIREGHACVVKLLVAGGAVSLFSGNGQSCLDKAFNSNNAALVGAIAQGLMSSPWLLDRLSRADLIRFLKSDDQIPCWILQSVFQPFEIWLWEEGFAGRTKRTKRNQALFWKGLGLNVACGPHPSQFENIFKSKQTLPKKHLTFLSKLAPLQHTSRRRKRMSFGPARFLVCRVPGIHNYLDVLLALADTPCEPLFKEPACQAIIELVSQTVTRSTKIRVVMAVLEICNLVSVNLLLNQEFGFKSHKPLEISIVVGQIISGIDLFVYSLQALGYCQQSLLHRFARELFPGFVLCVTCAILAYTDQNGVAAKSSPTYCTLFGAVIFTKWMQLLFELCQFPFIGLRILPITSSMLDVGPFCCVMAVCVLASTNLYYALGLYGPRRSLMIIYRLAVLSDFDLSELENVWASKMRIETGGSTRQVSTLKKTVSEGTDYYWVVRGILVLISFTMSISLMNLFIGVLTVSYSEQCTKAKTSYSRFRVHAIVKAQAVIAGLSTLTHFTLFRCESVSEKPDPDGQRAPRFKTRRTFAAVSRSAVQERLTAKTSLHDDGAFMWVCLSSEHQVCRNDEVVQH